MVDAVPRGSVNEDTDPRSQRSAAHRFGGREASDILPTDPWMRASQVAVIGLFVIALLWCAQVAGPVVVPIVLAWVVSTILLPIVRLMQARNVPRFLAALLLTAALVAAIVIVLVLLATPITYWLGRAAELGALLREKLQLLSRPLALVDEIRQTLSTVTTGEAGALKVEQPAANVITASQRLRSPGW
jgi:predicted PurR-regulated permease PerM